MQTAGEDQAKKEGREWLQRFREEGGMPGVYHWLDESGHTVDEIRECRFEGFTRELPSEPGSPWKTFEPLPTRVVIFVFTDDTVIAKAFTPEEMRGE